MVRAKNQRRCTMGPAVKAGNECGDGGDGGEMRVVSRASTAMLRNFSQSGPESKLSREIAWHRSCLQGWPAAQTSGASRGPRLPRTCAVTAPPRSIQVAIFQFLPGGRSHRSTCIQSRVIQSSVKLGRGSGPRTPSPSRNTRHYHGYCRHSRSSNRKMESCRTHRWLALRPE